MENYWTYKSERGVIENPPDYFNITKEEWQKFSPGYRREIVRQEHKIQNETSAG